VPEVVPMSKRLRIWISGELVTDETLDDHSIHPDGLIGPLHEKVLAVMATSWTLPWRVELGDLDTDVHDAEWPASAI
jgi:hypothetical protein